MSDTATALGSPAQPDSGIIQPEVVSAPPMARKVYESARFAKADTPMSITIDGTEFITRPGRVPGAVTIEFSGLTVTRDPEAMWNYFKCAFVEDEKFEAFRDFLNDPVRQVQMDLLGEIIKDMIEFGNGLPTVRSSS